MYFDKKKRLFRQTEFYLSEMNEQIQGRKMPSFDFTKFLPTYFSKFSGAAKFEIRILAEFEGANFTFS